MKELFLAITAQLETVEALEWVDDDYGQLENYNTRPEIAFPAALVKISYPNTQDTGAAEDMEQIITAQVQVRLAFEPNGETYNAAPEEVRQLALARFDLAEQVHKALQGFSNENKMNALTRLSQTDETRRDGYKVIRAIYQTNFIESHTKGVVFSELLKQVDGNGTVIGNPGDFVEISGNRYFFQEGIRNWLWDVPFENSIIFTLLPIFGATTDYFRHVIEVFSEINFPSGSGNTSFQLLFNTPGSEQSPAAYHLRHNIGKTQVNQQFAAGEPFRLMLTHSSLTLMRENGDWLHSYNHPEVFKKIGLRRSNAGGGIFCIDLIDVQID